MYTLHCKTRFIYTVQKVCMMQAVADEHQLRQSVTCPVENSERVVELTESAFL